MKVRIKVKDIFTHPWVVSFEKEYKKKQIPLIEKNPPPQSYNKIIIEQEFESKIILKNNYKGSEKKQPQMNKLNLQGLNNENQPNFSLFDNKENNFSLFDQVLNKVQEKNKSNHGKKPGFLSKGNSINNSFEKNLSADRDLDDRKKSVKSSRNNKSNAEENKNKLFRLSGELGFVENVDNQFFLLKEDESVNNINTKSKVNDSNDNTLVIKSKSGFNKNNSVKLNKLHNKDEKEVERLEKKQIDIRNYDSASSGKNNLNKDKSDSNKIKEAIKEKADAIKKNKKKEDIITIDPLDEDGDEDISIKKKANSKPNNKGNKKGNEFNLLNYNDEEQEEDSYSIFKAQNNLEGDYHSNNKAYNEVKNLRFENKNKDKDAMNFELLPEREKRESKNIKMKKADKNYEKNLNENNAHFVDKQ